jgi:aarF domain-containing kinase
MRYLTAQNMLLIGNFCHSDLHPGNILIKFFKPTTKNILASLWAGYTDQSPKRADLASDLENQEGLAIVHRLRALSHDRVAWLAELERLDEEGYQPEIVFIDAGLVTQLNEKNRSDFLDLFTAVASFDGYKAGRLMVERCRAPELVINEETFALRMQHLILSVKSQTFSLAKIRIADILSDVLFNVREHHVKLEPDFVNVVISILLLEGIGRQLDPALDIFKSAVPIIRQLGRQLAPSISTSGIGVKDLGSLVKVSLSSSLDSTDAIDF